MAGELEVNKINECGQIVETYKSCAEAALCNGISRNVLYKVIKQYPNKKINGYLYRYSGVHTYRVNYAYDIGETIDDEYGSIEIISQELIDNRKYYKYKCLKCGYIGLIEEYRIIKRNQRCARCCKNSKIIDGNTLLDKYPKFKDILVNPQDGYNVLPGSNKKIATKCPKCGNVHNIAVNKLVKRGYNCNKCGVGISLPNRVIRSILEYIDIPFECEKSFEWSQDRRYDFYLPEDNIIIEVDGLQHYIGFGEFNTIEDIKFNDRHKEELAKENGINNYLHIDARQSDVNYIINSVNKIDFFKKYRIEANMIPKWVVSNNVQDEIIKLYSDGKSTTEIGNVLKLTKNTIIKYLKHYDALHIITYNPKESINCRKRKQVIDTETGIIYDSILDASIKLEVNRYSIRHSKRFKILDNENS